MTADFLQPIDDPSSEPNRRFQHPLSPVRVSTEKTLHDSDEDDNMTAVEPSASISPVAGGDKRALYWSNGSRNNSLSSSTTSVAELAAATSNSKEVVPCQLPKIKRFANVGQVLLHAAKGGMRSFGLALALRGGISFLISLLKVMKKKMTFVDAAKLLYGPDAMRFAKMVGSFSFIWKFVLNLLHLANRKRLLPSVLLSKPKTITEDSEKDKNTATLTQDRIFSFIAGSIAGVSVMFENGPNRVAVMQQLGIRSLQAFYGHLHARSIFSIPHGDSLLFMLATGSILYGYVMQPNTIPREYYLWMIKTARMPKEMLELNRANVRSIETVGKGILDLDKVAHAVHKHGGINSWRALNATHQYIAQNGGHLPTVPCSVMHPSTDSCAGYGTSLFFKVVRMMAPVNATLNLVPLVLFKAKEVIKEPISAVRRTAFSTLRSSVFLAAFVSTFQAGICMHRDLVARGEIKKDHKFFYYILGFLSGWSIFLEKKSRRSELVLYCLPKALESFYMVLLNRKLLIHIPGSEIVATSLAMGVLMSQYRCEPETVQGLLAKVLDRMLGKY
ncbi:hypothetical protein HDU97_000915 [Phlyctochytrium planicorne]|nr:hypothetical protein HDU97_000915 [Phlyctochytrium planicorne]